MPRPRLWTDEQLTEAVAASRTWKEVCCRLGLVPGRYEHFRRHADRLGLDTSHLPIGTAARRTWTDEQLVAVVRYSDTMAGVLRGLGYRPSGGIHRLITGHVRRLGLDTSHFTGRAWCRGRTAPTRRTIPLDEILVSPSTYPTSRLRKRLIAAGIRPARCEQCGFDSWRGRTLPLTLDHVNGDHTDNRLENLRILCPNCHSLTETWCSRKA